MGYSVIDDCELQDVERAIREYGSRPDDFELHEKAVPYSETGTVRVKNRVSGVERHYPIGHGAIFPADFETDLWRGLFH